MTSHPTDELDAQTRDSIAHARQCENATSPSLPFNDIGALLAHRAAETPDTNFLTSYAENGACATYTYAEFAEAVSGVAGDLAGPLGLTAGDRLATLMTNDARTVLLYFAAWTLGVCVVPVKVSTYMYSIEEGQR